MMLRRWHKDNAKCLICESVFFTIEVSLRKHRSNVLQSKITSMNGEAQCKRCGARYGITNPGMKNFRLLTPAGTDPTYDNLRTQARAWDRTGSPNE